MEVTDRDRGIMQAAGMLGKSERRLPYMCVVLLAASSLVQEPCTAAAAPQGSAPAVSAGTPPVTLPVTQQEGEGSSLLSPGRRCMYSCSVFVMLHQACTV